jgi:hypothetical protein
MATSDIPTAHQQCEKWCGIALVDDCIERDGVRHGHQVRTEDLFDTQEEAMQAARNLMHNIGGMGYMARRIRSNENGR